MEYHGTLFVQHQSIIISFAAVVAASFLFHWIPIETLRYIAIALLAAQVWLEIKNGQNLFLTSPPFLLSCCSIFFFSFLQGVTDHLSEIPSRDFVKSIGSEAERYVAAFAMASLVTHAFIVLYTKNNPTIKQYSHIEKSSYLPKIFLIFLTILAISNVIYYYFSNDQTISYYKPLQSLSPPLQAFMLIYLIRLGVLKERRFNALSALVFVISISSMFAVHEGKIPIFITTAASLYWLRIADVSIKKILLSGMAFVMFGIGAVNLMQAVRLPHASLLSTENTFEARLHKIQNVLAWKTIWRQTETVYCLDNVINSHRDQPLVLSKQLFWLQGLVPRILWPDKPSLSLGQDYSTRYCGFWSKGPHSSSITMLGQPVIHGGWLGLLLHGGLLLAGLAGLTWWSRDPYNLSSTSIAALLPWLIDFDQDFALYVANAVKFSLVMLPLILVANLSERRRSA